jgi:hypothetical protein
MREKQFVRWGVLFIILLLLPLSALGQKKEISLIGEEPLLFTLPSTQDRAISYLSEYYGKHHLVMTFFPAAFTPT